jgi:S-disulfanyl-L-cysteine oxidoreductase SoxD
MFRWVEKLKRRDAELRRVSQKALKGFLSAVLCALCASALETSYAQTRSFLNIGRTATPQEIKAWDIDVRPDFKGLPKGQGSVKQGEVIWEAQCASCHGHFGESSEVFTPIAGGVTPEDMTTGRVKSLLPGQNQPQRTTVMKLSTLSTLWDYINRAMPWTSPKSLSADDVYASTAYILHLSNVLPADFVLSDTNIRDVQARLPNRNGMTTVHSLWPGSELGGSTKPDVQGSSCMSNCAVQTAIVSSLPDHARDAHGNLAEQSRLVGASRGALTLAAKDLKMAQNGQNNASNMPVAQSIRAQAAPENIASAVPTLAQIKTLLDKNACLACHGMSSKLVGPSLKDVAERYKSQSGAFNLVSGKIKNGGQGVWGAIPMPAQALSVDEANQIAKWLMGGMPP